MDWFERLTGFGEGTYEETQAKLKVDGRQIRSLVNSKSYGIGEFNLVPLQTLREQARSAGGTCGRSALPAKGWPRPPSSIRTNSSFSAAFRLSNRIPCCALLRRASVPCRAKPARKREEVISP
jgi:hypothetical protein